MKKILRPLILALTAVAISTYAVGAADLLYDVNSGKLSVEYTEASKYGKFANISILPVTTVRDTLSVLNIDASKMLFDVIEPENNLFKHDYQVSGALAYGEYVLYIDFENTSTGYIFINSDMEKLNDIVAPVNAGNDLPEVLEFGANQNIYSDNIKNIRLLLKNQKKGLFTNSSFIKAYLKAEGFSRLKNGDIKADDFFKIYFSLFDDMPVYNEAWKETQLKSFEQVIASEPLLNLTPEQIVRDAIWLNEAKNCADSNVLAELMCKYIDKHSLSYGKYKELNSYYQQQTTANLLTKKNSCLVFKDLYDEFITLSQASYKKYSGFSENVSGGSSGGSSGGGGKSIKLPQTESDVSQNKSQFNDISSHWSKEYVEELSKDKILTGYADSTFRPDEKIKRAELAVVISRILKLEPETENDFSDVSADSWFNGYIGAVNKVGIVKGDNGRFYPNAAVSRQDAAVMLFRMLLYRNDTFSGENSFADKEQIAPYAQESVGALASNGIITGFENQFRPYDNITRGEAAALISRALKLL